MARVTQHFYAGAVPVPKVHRASSGELPRIVHYNSIEKAAELIANWYSRRGGTIGVVVARNSTGSKVRRILKQRLQQARVDIYSSDRRNEDTIDVLVPGVTVLNEKSVKGQEFDTVFIMETDRFFNRNEAATKRSMYMLCSRARDNLFLMVEGTGIPRALDAKLPNSKLLRRS